MKRTIVFVYPVLIALVAGACEHLGDNLSGKAYLDGEPAPGYALIEGEYVKVEVDEGDYSPEIDAAVGDLCGSDAALAVRPHDNGIGSSCVLLDGPRRTIIVHDGVNVPAVVVGGVSHKNGAARWNDSLTECEVWLAPGSGPETAAHEIKHCRLGHWHS